jgi:hypothetical protein
MASSTATNLAGGVKGSIPYQSNPGLTTFLGIGAQNQLLSVNASGVPAWVNRDTLSVTTASFAQDVLGGAKGSILYQNAVDDTVFLAIGTENQILTVNASGVPEWVNRDTLSVTSADNLTGGAVGSIPYQNSVNDTVFLSIGSENQVLTVGSNGKPTWSGNVNQSNTSLTSTTATNLAGGVKGSIPYQSNPGLTTFLGIGLENQILKVSAEGIPFWSDTAGAAGSAADADKLDGLNSTQFLRSDVGDTWAATDGPLIITTPTGALGNNTGQVNTLQVYQATLNTDAYMTFHIGSDYAVHFGLDGTTNDLFVGGWSAGAVKNKILHLGNTSSTDVTFDVVRAKQFYDSENSNYSWNPNTSDAHRFNTPSGWLDLGPMNSSYCHFQTDRDLFYFNKTIDVDGSVRLYDDNANRFDLGTLVLRGASPTVYLRDTNNNSAMLHCTSDLFYILRGGNDTETWSQVNSQWPAYWNLTNNHMFAGGDINAVGEVTAYYSDRRLKTNVKPLENALEKVEKLNGITYNPNDLAESFGYDKSTNLVGLFADEVESVLPEAVKNAPFDRDENGNSKSGENYKTVQYERLIPLLIEAIKELSEEVKQLKSKQ